MKIITHWPGAGKHYLMLALAWLSFSVMFGLFGAFDAMESSANNIASQAMIGALKTAGLVMLAGFVVFSIPILVYLMVRQRDHPLPGKQ